MKNPLANTSTSFFRATEPQGACFQAWGKHPHPPLPRYYEVHFALEEKKSALSNNTEDRIKAYFTFPMVKCGVAFHIQRRIKSVLNARKQLCALSKLINGGFVLIPLADDFIKNFSTPSSFHPTNHLSTFSKALSVFVATFKGMIILNVLFLKQKISDMLVRSTVPKIEGNCK